MPVQDAEEPAIRSNAFAATAERAVLPRDGQPDDRADGKRLLGAAMLRVGPSGGIPMERGPLSKRTPSTRDAPPPRPPWITPLPRVASAKFPAPRFPAGVAVPPLALLGTLLAGAIGLAMIHVEEAVVVLGGPAGWPGVMPGAAVALVAVWAWFTLRGCVVGPVRRLRDNVTRGRLIQGSIVSDVDRIAVDVRDRLRPLSRCTPRRFPYLAVPMTAVLVLVGVVVLASLAVSYAMMSSSNTSDARALAVATGQDTALAAGRLRSALRGGLSTLQGMAGPEAGDATDPGRTVATVVATRQVFRAAYILDPAGRLVATAGAQPRTLSAPPPAGIGQLNTSGSAPLIVAAASLYNGNTLVGEYDPRALNEALRISGARMRVVDAGLRTLLSNHGYEAFSALHEPQLQAAAKAAAPPDIVPVATLHALENADALIAAQHIGGRDDPLGRLDWVLLANQDLSDGEFAHNPTARAAAVVTGLSAGLALAVLCWIYVTTVRPLRGAAALAAAIGAARKGEAPPASAPAQRMDEIGAIIAGLNRQLHALVAAPPTQPPPTRAAAPLGPSTSRPRAARRLPHLIEHGLADCHHDDRATHNILAGTSDDLSTHPLRRWLRDSAGHRACRAAPPPPPPAQHPAPDRGERHSWQELDHAAVRRRIARWRRRDRR
jgi:hypothetical protein